LKKGGKRKKESQISEKGRINEKKQRRTNETRVRKIEIMKIKKMSTNSPSDAAACSENSEVAYVTLVTSCCIRKSIGHAIKYRFVCVCEDPCTRDRILLTLPQATTHLCLLRDLTSFPHFILLLFIYNVVQ
jgi:hypothetical protein